MGKARELRDLPFRPGKVLDAPNPKENALDAPLSSIRQNVTHLRAHMLHMSYAEVGLLRVYPG